MTDLKERTEYNKIKKSPKSMELNFPKPQFKKSFVSLLSTGLDSPIATYLIMKQGYDCYSLSFLNGKEKSKENREKIIKTGKKLMSLTNQQIRMHFIDYDEIIEEIGTKIEGKILCILCKRIMIRVAAKLAEHYEANIIVNGDILGEQASQTLDNLYVVHQVNKKIPVIRPIIGFDKLDIIKISQNIGLYDISLIKTPGCENNPKFPETRAKLDMILENERNANIDDSILKIVKNLEYFDIKI
jgi:tRNA uracil 4-sulfurtransferase